MGGANTSESLANSTQARTCALKLIGAFRMDQAGARPIQSWASYSEDGRRLLESIGKEKRQRGGWPNADLLLVINLARRAACLRINLAHEITVTALLVLVLSKIKCFLNNKREVLSILGQRKAGQQTDQMLGFEKWGTQWKMDGLGMKKPFSGLSVTSKDRF